MPGSDFLAKIKLALEGKDQVVSGLQETQQAAQQLSKIKVTTIFDKEGVTTGKQIEETFTKIKPAAQKAGIGMKDFINAMKRALIVAPVWMLMRNVIMGVFSAIQALPAAAIAWEKEMAQIKRVGKGTEAEYSLLSDRLLNLSKTYGITAEKMGKGAALWAQQGKSLTEIVPLMETTIKLSLITGKTVESSVEDITAIMKSYKIEASETTSILDKLIKVEQGHAITADVLTDAMKRGGPVAAQFGVSFEKFLGIVTATHVATRAAGGEIGNAWKTIFARMATSAIPAIQNIAKVPVYMDKAGKSTYQNTGTFRDWGNVLDEVMVSMSTLSETEQVALASALAMKRTINYLLSAYQNWDEGIKATVESLDSFGASDKAANLLLGTTANKTQQLQSAWSELGVTIVNNGQFIKDSIDLLKSWTSGLNDVILIFHGLEGQELLNAKIAKEGLDEEIKYRNKQLGQLKSIIELKKLLGETKEFETRIKEEPKLGEEQKNKILTVIHERQKFIEETIAKQPKIEVGELFLETTIRRGEELQKIRDKITTMAIEAYKVAPEVKIGTLSTAPIKEIEDRIKAIKGIKPEFILGKEEELKNAVKYMEEILKLRQEENKIESIDYLTILEERLKNEKEFTKVAQEYQEANAKLTDEQEAQLQLERELSTYSIQRGRTDEEILQKKIELLKVSTQFNDEQERTLALEKTQNQLIETRLQKRKQEEATLMDLSMRYEEADMFEKARIRRLAELSMKQPEEAATAYEGGGYDKRIIQENFNQFTEAQRVAIAKTTELWKSMNSQLAPLITPPPIGAINPGVTPITPITNITGAQNINVTVDAGGMATAEEVINLINKMIDEKLMTDESFINTFAKRISPKI